MASLAASVLPLVQRASRTAGRPSCLAQHGSGLLSSRAWAPSRGAAATCRAAEADGDEPCTSGRTSISWQHAAVVTAVTGSLAGALLLHPLPALAGEELPSGWLDLLLLHATASPWGVVGFVTVVAVAECIPLFPTHPLSLASGLLFGVQKGALCTLTGTTLAALLAFSLSRGVGRPLAERIIRQELGESGGEGEEGSSQGVIKRSLARVVETIEGGNFWQQAGAIALLRLTPVPFSASNYMLGLSPLPLAPYLLGTMASMAFWSTFYASLGAASRSLMHSGVRADVLLGDLLQRAGSYTKEGATVAAGVGTVALLGLGVAAARRRMQRESGGAPDSSGPAPSPGSGPHPELEPTPANRES